jgi:hypothetical protein
MDWIKQHPYLTAGLVAGLLVVYLVFKNISAGSGTQSIVSAPAPDTGAADALSAVQAQTSADVANSQIQANVQAQTVDAQKQVALAQLQSAVIVGGQQTQSATDIANINAGRDISVAQTQAGRDVALAGTAASVAQYQAETALQAQQANDQASVAIAGLQTNAYVDVNAQQAQTQQLAITTTGDVYKTAIDVQGKVAETQLGNQQMQVNQFFQALNANDRFASGTAEVATLAAIEGAPGAAAGAAGAVGVAQANASTAPGNTPGGIISTIGHVITGIFGL